jgi:cytochrome b561
MAALLVLHIGAALKHKFIDRDGVMGRMSLLPRKRVEE